MRHRFYQKYVLLLLVIITAAGYAQMEMPREYVPEGEIVSINSDVNFSMAIELLSEYSVDYVGKPIYDPTRQSGAIGIDVQQMPWRQALEAILSRRGLWYQEQEHYFQIIESPDAQETEQERLMEELKIRPGQREIKIETIFFQGDRNKLAEIGVDWTTLYNGQVSMTAEQLGAFKATEDMLNLTVRVPNSLFGVDVEALLKAFDSNEIGTVLAQPQVTVTEGHEGMVQVGQDFSIKTRDFAGNITDRFFSTGTILRVTPYILEDEQGRIAIILNAHIEKSQASPSTVSTIIDKSEANSLVQLYDGEETIIAGLYSNENKQMRSGIPILKDLPWWFFGLRYLFGYDRTSVDQQELIIVMRASLLPTVHDRAASGFVTRARHRNPVRVLGRYRSQDYSKELRSMWNASVKSRPNADQDYFNYETSQESVQPRRRVRGGSKNRRFN
ncbi:MAG: type II and III secretion system protein [candidate division KSB1 bacterium]|nr:type II and III secretion system protein [candidate division KSB1 bacterium]